MFRALGGLGVCCLVIACCCVGLLIFGGFFCNVISFLRTSFVAWEMCTSFFVDMAFKMFNPHIIFVAVGAVNFPSFERFAFCCEAVD